MDTQTFITKANEIHGDKFDYSNMTTLDAEKYRTRINCAKQFSEMRDAIDIENDNQIRYSLEYFIHAVKKYKFSNEDENSNNFKSWVINTFEKNNQLVTGIYNSRLDFGTVNWDGFVFEWLTIPFMREFLDEMYPLDY